MFDDYAKRLEEIGDNVPKTFKRVAKRGANHFESTAKTETDKAKLVDTEAYKKNWEAHSGVSNDVHYIEARNNMGYASHLEYGHKLRNGKKWQGKFVGTKSLNDTEGWTILELREEIEALMLSKKHGISRGEARKLLK